jgi:hypothetical protein
MDNPLPSIEIEQRRRIAANEAMIRSLGLDTFPSIPNLFLGRGRGNPEGSLDIDGPEDKEQRRAARERRREARTQRRQAKEQRRFDKEQRRVARDQRRSPLGQSGSGPAEISD